MSCYRVGRVFHARWETKGTCLSSLALRARQRPRRREGLVVRRQTYFLGSPNAYTQLQGVHFRSAEISACSLMREAAAQSCHRGRDTSSSKSSGAKHRHKPSAARPERRSALTRMPQAAVAARYEDPVWYRHMMAPRRSRTGKALTEGTAAAQRATPSGAATRRRRATNESGGGGAQPQGARPEKRSRSPGV